MKAEVFAIRFRGMGLKYLEDLLVQASQAGRAADGATNAAELSFLAGLARDPRVKVIGEIGFNSGFSSYTFLAANPGALVYSFDLGQFSYSLPAKLHIDSLFPGRHTLIAGNCTETVPEFERGNPGLKFDVIFIDGGHDYETVRADLRNMGALATGDTVLVIDDLTPWKPWGAGPARAGQEAQQEGLATQSLLIQDGLVVTAAEPGEMRSRVWAVGGYTPCTVT